MLGACLGLAACGDNDAQRQAEQDRDPAGAAAINGPILTDPDLAAQNQGGAALTGGGAVDGALPAFKRSSEEVKAALVAARQVLGGQGAAAPPAQVKTEVSRLAGMATSQAIAAASGIVAKDCARLAHYSMVWAARLPAPLPVFPRGHAVMAAGSDQAGCEWRAVRFVTPVAITDLAGFYFTSAARAGLHPERRSEGGDDVIAGRGFMAAMRRRADGLSEVDLVTAPR